ncbi:hypothetical protein Dip510_000399 [Elusimicrobium posterum]|uniref:hypothetical protein n=1 Tax=Elusimicrobium posterum TaxID=3116653 RepID=UPI003C737D70
MKKILSSAFCLVLASAAFAGVEASLLAAGAQTGAMYEKAKVSSTQKGQRHDTVHVRFHRDKIGIEEHCTGVLLRKNMVLTTATCAAICMENNCNIISRFDYLKGKRQTEMHMSGKGRGVLIKPEYINKLQKNTAQKDFDKNNLALFVYISDNAKTDKVKKGYAPLADLEAGAYVFVNRDPQPVPVTFISGLKYGEGYFYSSDNVDALRFEDQGAALYNKDGKLAGIYAGKDTEASKPMNVFIAIDVSNADFIKQAIEKK